MGRLAVRRRRAGHAAGPVTPSSACAAIEVDDDTDDPENPPFAVEYGLGMYLDVGTVKSVVSNARLRVPPGSEVPADVLVWVLAFYFRNDAFIDLGTSDSEPGAVADPRA